MKLGIVGSRDFNNYLEFQVAVLPFLSNITEIVSGGAKGADSLAERFAVEHNIKMTVFKPDWNKYGRSAGMIRNKDIVENSDFVLAFWDGVSKGTKNSINRCKKLGKPFNIIYFNVIL